MKLVLERRDDPKVAAAASNAPEQILVLLGAGPQQLSVGGRHVGGDQVVASQSMTSVEPAQPAAEREPCDPRRRHDSQRRRQLERLGGAVELSQREPGLGPGYPSLWINPQGLHAGQVQHHGAVADGVPCNTVTAAAHRDGKVVSTCERDTAAHVGGIHRPDHGARAPIDHAVEHRTCLVVAAVAGADHLPPQTRPELQTNGSRDPSSIYRHCGTPLSASGLFSRAPPNTDHLRTATLDPGPRSPPQSAAMQLQWRLGREVITQLGARRQVERSSRLWTVYTWASTFPRPAGFRRRRLALWARNMDITMRTVDP